MGPRRTRALALVLALLAAPLAGSNPHTGRSAFLKAVQDLRAGRLVSARRRLRIALAADPGSLETRFYLGECQYHLGQLEKARIQLERVAKAEPAMPATHYYLGRLAYDQGRLADAFGELRQANSLDASLPMVHYYLGLVYRSHAQPDAAALEFERALDLEPRLSLAAYDLAWIQFHDFGRTAAARAALKRAKAGTRNAQLRKKIRALLAAMEDH
jgi:tetratricopeptide (TPR) repeat protein